MFGLMTWVIPMAYTHLTPKPLKIRNITQVGPNYTGSCHIVGETGIPHTAKKLWTNKINRIYYSERKLRPVTIVTVNVQGLGGGYYSPSLFVIGAF